MNRKQPQAGIAILDENGEPLEIGMRVGCRNKGESRSLSRRGLTLTGYESGTDAPYSTIEGYFALAIKDHQDDMAEWVANYVS